MCTIAAAPIVPSIGVRDNGVVARCEVLPSNLGNVLILDADTDCADALEMFLNDLPGVGEVRIVANAEAGLTLPQLANPAVIFIDCLLPHELGTSLHGTMTGLRERFPRAAIVILCLYPLREHDGAHRLADRCVRKDTSYRELRALTSELLASQP